MMSCSSSSKEIVLQSWELILTTPDYPDSYLVTPRLWDSVQERLKELRIDLGIEHTEGTDSIPYSDNYVRVSKEKWGQFLAEISLLRAKKKLKELESPE